MLNALTRYLIVVAVAAAGLLPAGAMAQTKPLVKTLAPDFPHSAIFIGNSFFYRNNSLHNQVLGLERAADPDHKGHYRATSVTISGSGLNWHDVESYFRPNAVGSYSFVGDNEIRFNKLDRLFDAAIMMDCSQCPIHPQLKDLFTEFAKKDSDIVRAHGAKPIFFMSWAYADKPEMTAQLAEAYTTAGNANNALVIPAGLAFARARAKQPDLNLYAPDKRHPNPAGSYLAASTVYAALTGKSPVGISYHASIDEKTASFLQQVAWDTVQDYYGK